jgi:hypothetical protein
MRSVKERVVKVGVVICSIAKSFGWKATKRISESPKELEASLATRAALVKVAKKDTSTHILLPVHTMFKLIIK